MNAPHAHDERFSGNNPSESNKTTTTRPIPDNLTFWAVLDYSTPWVLVPDGSFAGFFDWVPRRLRVGPWSVTACAFLAALSYSTLLAVVYYSFGSGDWGSSFAQVIYPEVFTVKWYYQAVTGCWMVYVMLLILRGPAGIKAWATYTVQSWTLLTTRHFLAALAPVCPPALIWSERLRFPVACSMTVTFTVWNFVLFPFCYFYGMKTEEKRRNFLKFATSFRLTQIHVFNLVFGVANLFWASPRRTLLGQDFCFAAVSTMVYMVWYLFVLDRLGIHLYPVFSPRAAPHLVFGVWSSLVGMYIATFFVWRAAMLPA